MPVYGVLSKGAAITDISVTVYRGTQDGSVFVKLEDLSGNLVGIINFFPDYWPHVKASLGIVEARMIQAGWVPGAPDLEIIPAPAGETTH